MPKKKLTPKQKLFCDYYLISHNATDSARKAGYSKRTAQAIGAENLTKPIIQEFLAKHSKKLTDEVQITKEQVINELAILALQDSKNLFDSNGNMIAIQDLPSTTSKTIAEIHTKHEVKGKGEDKRVDMITRIKTHDKKSALDSLAKYFGLFEKDNAQKQQSFVFEMDI